MKPYLSLLSEIIDDGEWKTNRTGVRTLMIDGAMRTYDLRKGFAAPTTKTLVWEGVTGELCGFLRGYTNAADFRALGCNVWNKDANQNQDWLDNPFRKGTDDLGPIYGAQWRNYQAFKLIPEDNKVLNNFVESSGYNFIDEIRDTVLPEPFNNGAYHNLYYKEIDQLGDCIKKIVNDPDNRRIVFHGWNPAVLDQVALPACHVLYQFFPNKETKEMSISMYQRSCDTFLGIPFNIASASLLLSLVCHLTGYTPKKFIHFMGDVHIYESHLDQVQEQLSRTPRAAPTLIINSRIPTFDEIVFKARGGQEGVDDHQAASTVDVIKEILYWLEHVEPSDFTLLNYDPDAAIKAVMSTTPLREEKTC